MEEQGEPALFEGRQKAAGLGLLKAAGVAMKAASLEPAYNVGRRPCGGLWSRPSFKLFHLFLFSIGFRIYMSLGRVFSSFEYFICVKTLLERFSLFLFLDWNI